jgi:spore photoproduct lyase
LDTAKNFKPDKILLWDKVSDNFEAQRIINLFKNAEVQIIKNQKPRYSKSISMAEALQNSKKTLMIGETSSFTNYFDGNIGNGMRCFSYYKLVPLSNGCPYNCVYCYLAYVYRKYGAFIKININYDKMLRQIKKLAMSNPDKICFNFGEMLDSLALNHITNITSLLIPFFENFSNKYLMMLTKSINIDNLLKIKPNPQVVVSWSLNPQTIIDKFETGTASLDERINAAKQCQGHDYRIRFRIDPGILCDNWKTTYESLLKKIFTYTEPENITIGMLRLFKGHINLSKRAYDINGELKIFDLLKENARDNKLRYIFEQRLEFYKFMIDAILSYHKKTSIGICRESQEIHEQLSYKRHLCNCIG